MKDFAKASALANKEIELVIHAKVKKESVLPEIPNTAKITYTNKNNESKEKETEPVKVTPPPITKSKQADQEDRRQQAPSNIQWIQSSNCSR